MTGRVVESNDVIERLRATIVRIPARALHSHGSGDVRAINSVILEVTTRSGVTGWGEASPWPVFTGTVEAAAAALISYIGPHLIGRNPFRITELMCLADQLIVDCNEAKAAIEMALLDIVGKSTGLSISTLLGGRCRNSIPLSISIANPDFDADLKDIAGFVNDGVRIFKLKTGFSSHAFDIMRLKTLREQYGDEVRLRVDYNQGLPAYDAMRQLREIEASHPDFIEQPVRRDDRSAMAAITAALDTPVMADESVFTPLEALEGAQARIADIYSLKIMKSGGIRKALEVASIARAAAVDVYGGCMFETGIAHAAGTHLMACVTELRLGCEFYMANYYLEEDILTRRFPVDKGCVHVPTGPGLGVEIDRYKLAAFQQSVLEHCTSSPN